MANLYVNEYSEFSEHPVAKVPAIINQKVVFTTTAGKSAEFSSVTHYVRIQADAACFILFGREPTVLAGAGMPLAANVAEYFQVNPLDKVSVVQ